MSKYVGLKKGKVHNKRIISEYYCGGCGWPVTDHDSYCSECGGALHEGGERMTGEVCSDGRFELIGKAKRKLLECTNIESRPEEIAVLDNILYRCWQMGWLDKLRENEE